MKRFCSVALIVMCSLLLVDRVEAGHANISYSGVVLDQGNNPVLTQFTGWLSRKSGHPLGISYKESYQAISDDLREHRDSFAWTCGVPFVEDHDRDGQQLIAVPLFRGQPSYYSVTVARSERSETKLADFKGKVLAYSDPRSNSGFVAPSAALRKQGFKINEHFRFLLHTGLHQGSIDAVLNGLADVANVDEYILVEHLKMHPEDGSRLKVLERFGPFPFTPIVAGRDVSQEVIQRFQDALVVMHEDKEGAAILNKLGLDGFVLKPNSFYQPIRDMLKTVKE